ncbi:hypothetical protein CC2G_002175 [Coprinopsis cinerea AmutBmut pab1-1]|nr:hypothetical protein CC2G_002175 [Coprinopsis cinerea AmutBmut pab1-1]
MTTHGCEHQCMGLLPMHQSDAHVTSRPGNGFADVSNLCSVAYVEQAGRKLQLFPWALRRSLKLVSSKLELLMYPLTNWSLVTARLGLLTTCTVRP